MVGTATALLAAGCASTGTTSTGAAGATGTGPASATAATATPPDQAAIGTSFAPATHAPPSAATPAGPAVVYGCDQQAVAKPKTYVLMCGDGGVALDKLTWTGWGKPKATATGVQIQNSCVPDCAAGSPISSKATVTVSGLSAGHYTKLHVVTSKGATDYTISAAGPLVKG
ncbi:hypothetical protein KGQ20_33120 [Catenulispora sp. NF23]|uniref:Lipoprotein n=1 Tax=Catenulispora pinistramenti TaxID=2705254 RepID=A0ABS5L534_9ACTN|nr:hypothetical protein [Catenulispora pinistramenti]MBS2537604.1 hypothetical protein [Catenulispora pinistramenti]MBS2553467.1 hypothetical protein [Catenulispora pinistramenti]